MVPLVALLVSHCCLNAAVAGSTVGLERIDDCGTTCSEGLQCKIKPHSLFPPPCQNPTESLNASSVLRNISLSTVMRCEGRQKCSLHLRISTELQLTEAIHGLSICTITGGMMANCRNVKFTRESRKTMSGLKVEVGNDCNHVSPGQQVEIRVKTVPSYCGVTWTGTYFAPGCSAEDLQRHVPECITGRLSYDVNPQKKELSVRVSDMLEDRNYLLRLCHKDFMCTSTGSKALIKKEEPVKKAVLHYSRPLPCLCIEGWSIVPDAPRVQVCPFKDCIEELWFGINYEPLEESLSWEPACPVTAVIALCQRTDNDDCVNLPHSSRNVSREKVTFSKVDPHPQLCMKFTAGSRSWIRCPFADAGFPAWEVVSAKGQSHRVAKLSSRINATFSVGPCTTAEGSVVCPTRGTHTIHVEKLQAVPLNLTGQHCKSCIQVKRIDVEFAATVIHCLERCNQPFSRAVNSHQDSLNLTFVVVPICVLLIIFGATVLHLLFKAYQRKNRKANEGSEKQTDAAFDYVVPALQTKPILCGGVLIPDSPQSEKANLISDS